MFLLNSLGMHDIIFFSAIGALIAICIILYFLIPVLNKKKYKEAREEYKKREEVFRNNQLK